MKQIKLAIWDQDREYSEALAAAIANRYREYTVTVLDCWEQMDADTWEVLLLDEDAPHKEASYKEAPNDNSASTRPREENIIWLTDNKTVDLGRIIKDEAQPRAEIYRYERVSGLVGQIRFWHCLRTGDVCRPRGEEQLSGCVSVISATDRAVTETAQVLVEELAALEHTVLLVNFEEFPNAHAAEMSFTEHGLDAERGLGAERGLDMGDYLYYLLGAKKERLYRQVELFLADSGKGGRMFRLAAGRNPLRELNQGEMESFLNTVLTAGFDWVVCSLGAGTFSYTSLVLKYSTEILMPEERTEMEREKNTQLKGYLQQSGTEHALSGQFHTLGETGADNPVAGKISAEERKKEVRQFVRKLNSRPGQCSAADGERDYRWNPAGDQQQGCGHQ